MVAESQIKMQKTRGCRFKIQVIGLHHIEKEYVIEALSSVTPIILV